MGVSMPAGAGASSDKGQIHLPRSMAELPEVILVASSNGEVEVTGHHVRALAGRHILMGSARTAAHEPRNAGGQ
jgi:hypothetical protein